MKFELLAGGREFKRAVCPVDDANIVAGNDNPAVCCGPEGIAIDEYVAIDRFNVDAADDDGLTVSSIALDDDMHIFTVFILVAGHGSGRAAGRD